MSRLCPLYERNLIWSANTNRYVVSSLLMPPFAQYGRYPEFRAESHLSISFPNAMNFNQVNVTLKEPIQIGQLDLIQIAALGSETMPNQRKFANCLGPLMNLTSA